jgi:hypothetical protein
MLMTKTFPVNRNNWPWHSVVFIALVMLVARAHGQPAKRVIIEMNGECHDLATSPMRRITVVLTVGTVSETFDATRTNPGEPWVGRYPNGKTFEVSQAKASLRFGTFRTECIPINAPKTVEASKTEDAAVFSFDCDDQPVRAVIIQSDGPVWIRYLRRGRSKICPHEVERQSFKAGTPHPISDMWIPGDEEFRLVFGANMPTPPEALLVFSLDPQAKDLPVFSKDLENSELLVFRDSKGRQHKQKTVSELSLMGQDVANLLMSQHLAKFGTIEENGNDYNGKRFEVDGLKKLTLAVK